MNIALSRGHGLWSWRSYVFIVPLRKVKDGISVTSKKGKAMSKKKELMSVKRESTAGLRAIIESVIFSVIFWFIALYFMLVPVNLTSKMFDLLISVWVFIIGLIIKHANNDKKSKPAIVFLRVGSLAFGALLIAMLFSAPLFHAKSFAGIAPEPETVDFADTIAEFDPKAGNVALLDTKTSEVLSERELGSLTDIASQFELDRATTIEQNGLLIKVQPLDYSNVMKYFSNRVNGTPGYVKVNSDSGKAELVRLDKGLHYTPGACFSDDLMRHVYNYDMTRLYGKDWFEIDDEGKPYFIVPFYKHKSFLFANELQGILSVDAVSGEVREYQVKDIPEWVDTAFNGDYIAKIYEDHYMLKNGFLNSVFSQTGCFELTRTYTINEDGEKEYGDNDYGYIAVNDDMYVYTGVTSATKDASDIVMLMVNTRTGESRFFAIAGADEGSAMGAAEGELQQYGYKASFPSLINVNGRPVYLMVLTDANNIVKNMAMVDMQEYSIVATGKTKADVLKSYLGITGHVTADNTGTDINTDDIEKARSFSIDSDEKGTSITITLEDGTIKHYKISK